jgi:hypothetical protein
MYAANRGNSKPGGAQPSSGTDDRASTQSESSAFPHKGGSTHQYASKAGRIGRKKKTNEDVPGGTGERGVGGAVSRGNAR